MDPHSIGHPDPHSECGSGTGRPGGLKKAKMKKKRSKKPDN
jgi:hypothetical protein